MKRALLVLIPVAFAAGCHGLAHISQSAFLSKFSLEKSAKQTGYRGINKSRGPGGAAGGSSGITGQRGTDVDQTSWTAFSITEEGDDKFIESEFMKALASQIRTEIEERHGTVTATGSPTAGEFYIEYKDGNIRGRITVSGSESGQHYTLEARITESSKP